MAPKGVTFEGGEKLEAFFKNAGKGGVKGIDVGFFSSSKYKNGTQVAYVAAIHELGLGHNPERPYFTLAMKAAIPKLLAVLKATDPKTAVVSPAQAKALGKIAEGELQRSIRNLRQPGNALSTVKAKTRKGSGEKDNPLIDTGFMRESATFEVIK